jgi:hypothetical protein
MSLQPILALDHVIAAYRDYLHSGFRAEDPGLRASLEAELDKPLFLAQEPFFQAHRPFQKGKRWKDLPLDSKLARVMEERSRDERAYRRRGVRSQGSGFRGRGRVAANSRGRLAVMAVGASRE